MKKKSFLTFFTLLFLFQSFVNFAQEKLETQKKLEIAEKKYYNNLYIDAINIYLELAKENLLDENGLKKLANSYYFNSDYVNAHKWYEEIFEKSPLQTSEYCYRYGQSLKSVGNYSEANRIMEKFSNLASQEVRARLIRENKDYLQKIKDNSNRYDTALLNINSSMSDFGVAFWGANLVFTSNRNFDKVSKNSNEVLEKLFVATKDADGDFQQPTLLFNKKNKNHYNESSAVFTKDGQTMYFTRNISKKDITRKSSELNLRIFRATLKKGVWTNIVQLPFNKKDYNTSHPALSPDEKRLYFSSDMPGTIGLSDIFYVDILPNNTYSAPVNLGDAINTEGRENFPFIPNNEELYFSSDGRPGLGGLDVFVAKKDTTNTFVSVYNLGTPINTAQDDFAYTIDNETRIGYFSTNRPNGVGKDDMYWFFEKDNIDTYKSTDQLVDKFTGLPIEGAKITLLNDQFKEIATALTDKNGKYEFNKVPFNKKMYLRVEKDAYLTDEIVWETKESRDPLNYKNSTENQPSIQIEKRIAEIEKGDDLAKLLEIGNLYFDFEKFDITPKAEAQLEKIAKLLLLYPEVKIEVKTYTDSRGTVPFNQKLSDNRCKAVINWLKNKGITHNRLSGKGYGETHIINHCKDGVECTTEEHELNRRCEFIFF